MHDGANARRVGNVRAALIGAGVPASRPSLVASPMVSPVTAWERLSHGFQASAMLQYYSSLPFNITSGLTSLPRDLPFEGPIYARPGVTLAPAFFLAAAPAATLAACCFRSSSADR